MTTYDNRNMRNWLRGGYGALRGCEYFLCMIALLQIPDNFASESGNPGTGN
jgi:hypothetical protein